MLQQEKSDTAISLSHCHRSPSGRFYSFLRLPGISSLGIFVLPALGKVPATQTHAPTWKLAQTTCNIWHYKSCSLLKLLVILKPKGRQRRKEIKWHICLDGFLYMCLMVTDAQLWGVKLLTLHESSTQEIKFGWAKAFLSICLLPKYIEITWLAIYSEPCNFVCNSHKVCKALIYLNSTSLFLGVTRRPHGFLVHRNLWSHNPRDCLQPHSHTTWSEALPAKQLGGAGAPLPPLLPFSTC